MPPSPKIDSSSFISDDTSILLPPKRTSISFRRTRRIPFILSFPITLLFIYYILLPSGVENVAIFDGHAPYRLYAGKSALETTIVLPEIQHKFAKGQGGDVVRRTKVKEAIQRTWELYSSEAWGWDEVKPVEGGGRDTRNGWGATIVDGLSTLILAGLEEELFDALNYTVQIDFTAPDGLVDPYVGGLVSTVDLLEYGLAGPNFDSRGLAAIRKQAEILVQKLAPGLDTPTRMWMPRVDFRTGKGTMEDLWGDTTISLARAGSNILEYGRLSELTHDLQYLKNATAAWWPLIQPRKESIIPGMIANPVSIETGNSMGEEIQWGAGHDSFYEYLIKAYQLWPNTKTELYKDRWVLAVENTMKNLSSWSLPTAVQPPYRYLAIHDKRKKNEMGHLTCFAPGNILLGARMLKREDIFRFGLDLMEGCWHSYNATPTGISPETWKWRSNDTSDEPYTQTSRKEWDNYGFWTSVRDYYLRPETIESLFYAYRLTGNKIYQERAWLAFQHISAATRAPYGYSAIRDVMIPGGWYQNDEQESFWLAETLKYLFLIFDDPQRISLDNWVFNTEAHPLRRGRKVNW